MTENVIKVEGLYKSFGDLSVLENVNLEVKAGEKIAIIGGSGCGKSVFLRSIEMLVKPDKGHIYINGQDICAKNADIDTIRRQVGMVYQQFNLFEHMDVMDNLCLAPTILLKMPREEAEAKALGLLKEVGLVGREHAWPKRLSGGQQQRIAIARCLMMDPQIMLLDEPTSALDPTMVGEVLATIRALGKKGLTLIIVTHEMSFARNFADRVLFLADHGIYEDGTAEQIFDNPQREKTIQFIRKLKRMDYHISERSFDLRALQGKIAAFCERYGIGEKRSWRLQLCVEELIEALMPHIDGIVDMDLVAEYSELEKGVSLLCNWKGDPYDPFNDPDCDNLGITILQHVARDIKTVSDAEGNHISCLMV